MRTFRDAEAMAGSLRDELRTRRELDIGHSEALEIVARQFGLTDWNVLSAKIANGSQPPMPSPDGINLTIPVMRIFSEQKARQFYLDFLGFHLDFGGPNQGDGTPFYGQVSRKGTTIHLSEHQYDPSPGSTLIVWLIGLEALYAELDERKDGVPVWGPAVWMPAIEELPWQVRSLTLPDPFGNVIRFYEPMSREAHPYLPEKLPRWASGSA